jgi:hypothetical protein
LGVPPSRLGAADFFHAKAFAFFALGGRELAKFGSALLTPVNNGLASLHGVFVNENVLYPKRPTIATTFSPITSFMSRNPSPHKWFTVLN